MTGPPAGWDGPIPGAGDAGLIVTEAWRQARRAAEATLAAVRGAADAEYAAALRALEDSQAAAREHVRTGTYASWEPQRVKAQAVLDRADQLRQGAMAVVERWQAGAGPGDLGPWYDAVARLRSMATETG